KSAVRVQVNPEALASTGFSLEDVRTFLAQANVDMPKGSIDGELNSYAIYSNDQLNRADKYRDLILAQKGGTPIVLHSFAKVIDGVENTRLAAWAGTKPAVLLIIFKQDGANVIETVDRIRSGLPQTEKWLPPSVKVQLISDRTTTIRSSVADVQFSLLLSVSLVVLVIFLFLRRFWPTFIASVSVPLAIAGTFGVMYLLGYSLDNLSLMAVTISVGFVVDDAIVVIENVFRFVEAGERPFAAALKGARQIGFTVTSMSVSLVAVFIPLLFMGGLIGRLFHEFAVTLSAAMLVSGIISLTLTPMMCSRFLKAESAHPPSGFILRACERGFNARQDFYERGLKWVLKHEYTMLIVTGLVIIATVYLYFVVPKGFFPQQDTGQMMGTTEAAQDISFEAMKEKQEEVVKTVMADPAVQAVGSFFGGGNGSALNNGRMFISLKPKGSGKAESKEDAGTVIALLRGKLLKS